MNPISIGRSALTNPRFSLSEPEPEPSNSPTSARYVHQPEWEAPLQRSCVIPSRNRDHQAETTRTSRIRPEFYLKMREKCAGALMVSSIGSMIMGTIILLAIPLSPLGWGLLAMSLICGVTVSQMIHTSL